MIATTILAIVGVAFFFALENRTRQGEQAASLERGAFDRSSTVFIGIAFMVSYVCLFAALALNWFGITIVPYASIVGIIGLVIELGGLNLRLWANRVLGQFYTRTLRVDAAQTVVDRGPYAVVRHPGYLGTLLLWLGAAVATANWVSVLIPLMMFPIYLYRIGSEEQMLASQMGDAYRVYQKRTWRLIPLIF